MTADEATEPAPAESDPPPFDPAELEAEAAEMARAPLDTIVLPLLAPLARLLSADDPAEDAEDEARFQASLAALADDPTLRTPAALVGAMRGGDYVVDTAAALLDAGHLADLLDLDDTDLPLPALTRAAKQWWQREQPPAPMAALVAAALMGPDARLLVERGSRPGRELARALFQYVRSKGATSWASAHELAHAWWSVAEHRERLLIRAWRGAWDVAHDAIERVTEVAAAGAAVAEAAAAEVLAGAEALPVAEAAGAVGPDPGLVALEARCAELARSERELRLELERVRAARSRAQERAEALEKELEPMRAARDRAEFHAKAMAYQLAEARATALTGDADPLEPPPADGWPPDLLAGVPLVLFTGQARAAAREAMAEALRLAGAEVEVFDGHVKGAGPERFDPTVTVVCDVRFLGHSSSDRIRARAERSGARVLEVKHGMGGIVRAVAEAVGRMRRSR